MALIELEKVSKTYRADELDVPALKDISLSVERGELVLRDSVLSVMLCRWAAVSSDFT